MGKRARRRAAAKDLARHMLENQVIPQLEAARLRAEGVDVEVGWVSTNPDTEGFTVTCSGCGRTAKMSHDPGGKVGLCPVCIRARMADDA